AGAALRMVRQAGPSRLVLAVPVASPEALDTLRSEADALVVIGVPDNFQAVGEWYRDFEQLSDKDVTTILGELERSRPRPEPARGVRIRAGRVYLDGDLTSPEVLRGTVVMAFGQGRGDPRWQAIASSLQRAGYATLLLDLSTEDGEEDAAVLGERLNAAVTWLRRATDSAGEPLGLMGSGSAAPAALVAAARSPQDVASVVVHGGRVDWAESALPGVSAPTLILLEGEDSFVRELGEWARSRLGGVSELGVVSGAERLLGDVQGWREVAVRAQDWFDRHMHHRSDRAR
ncbi:hypothetical protein, partial [Nocardiopsis alkaliphila]|uniref:hypothetical protein n=1 Tax=Nocardiopsis alkaliphila TaxID=225762 RepID=UPI000477A34F